MIWTRFLIGYYDNSATYLAGLIELIVPAFWASAAAAESESLVRLLFSFDGF